MKQSSIGLHTLMWAVFLAILLVVFKLAEAQTKYKVSDLGTLGGNQSFALDVNNSRQVTGNSRTPNSTLPLLGYRWEPGTMTNLGVLPGSNNFSRGYAINDAGVIVGESDNNASKAFRWENGTMTNLGTLGGASAVAHNINNAGQIVGSASNGQMKDLGTLLGTTNSTGRAWSINNSGDIVGVSRNAANTASQATLWLGGAGGSITNLGSLGSGNQFSEAFAISDNDWIVGYSIVTGSTEHAFLWQNGVLLDLGTLGFTHSRATDVNAQGQVVGFASTFANFPSFGGAAFLWENDQLINLNTRIVDSPGWNLLSAEGINERGDIVGFGTLNGQTRAFLLTAVPEPASLLLFAGGFLIAFTPIRRALTGTRN